MAHPRLDALQASRASWLDRIRIRQWWHFLVLPLAGFEWSASPLPLLRGVLISGCVLAFGYLLNAVTDRSMDLDARKNPLLTEPAASFRRTVFGLAVAALVLAAQAPLIVLAATLTSLASGWVYSAGPRLKAVPVIGTLLNATNFAPLLLVGVSSPLPSRLWPLLMAFSGMLLQNQLLHEAGDADEDRGGGVRTTFLFLGPRGATALAALFGGAVTAVPFVMGTSHLVTVLFGAAFVLAFPLLLARANADAMKKVRRIHRGCAALGGALLFWLLR